MDTFSSAVVFLALLPSFLFLLDKFLDVCVKRSNYNSIPTPGYSGRFTSYISAVKFITSANSMLQKGYSRFPDSIFKIAMIDKWEIVVNGKQLLDDVRRARDDELSFHHSSIDVLRMEYTLKSGIPENPLHTKVVSTNLSAKLSRFTPALHDEIVHIFDEIIEPTGPEWTRIPALELSRSLVTRVANRVFVGLPYCRDTEYLDLLTGLTNRLVASAVTINLFPRVLQPIVGPLLSPYNHNRNLGRKILGPTITERLQLYAEYGENWEGKPDDLISWLIDAAKPDQRQVDDLIMSLLFTNFAAIHTTSVVLTHAFFDLCTYPEYMDPIREEVRLVVEQGGWSQAAISRLHKLDSFLRESMRCFGVGSMSVMRKVLDPKGFRFSNGETAPFGSTISVPSRSIHHDPADYDDPEKFDGWRFYNLISKAEDAENVDSLRAKFSSTTTSVEYVPFGLGRRACPGRFFAIHEIKLLIAYLLVNYDFKLADSPHWGKGVRPPNSWIGYGLIPNESAHLLFRKRQG